jgi:hypothetical protein
MCRGCGNVALRAEAVIPPYGRSLNLRVGILFAVPVVEANCLSPEAEVYLQSKEFFFCNSMDLEDFDG